MKKFFTLTLALLMLLSFVACAKNNVSTTTPTDSESKATANDADETVADSTGDKTLAASLFDAFVQLAQAGDKTPEEIANKLVEEPVIEFSPVVMPVEEGFLNGFSAEISGFSAGATFAPMIGSIPFVGYVFTVNGDVDVFVQLLKDNADLRWNICVEADEMICEAVGNTVFFVMAPASLSE